MADEIKNGYTRKDWQGHYDSGDIPWDIGGVSPVFERLWKENQLKPGKVIIPGCGQGHEVLFLARNGFDVTAVDFSPGAVDLLKKALAKNDLKADVLHQDFFELNDSHSEFFDLMFEQTFFCAIHPDQRSLYAQTAARILKRGGRLAGFFYETGEEGGPPFNTTKQDVLDHFSDAFDILVLEKTQDSVENRKDKEWLGIFERK